MKTINTKNTVTPVYQKSRGAKTFDILHSLRLILSFALFGLLVLTAANLNANAQAADSFNPNVNNGSISSINTIVRQSDGKILIGGSFTIVGGQERYQIARVNADGTLDTTFTSPFRNGDVVFAIALQADGKILVAGGFQAAPQPFEYLVRLNTDGTRDFSFGPKFNNLVRSITIQSDGKIMVGGCFTIVEGSTNSIFRPLIARLNSDGSIDGTYDPQYASNPVNSGCSGGAGGVHRIIQQPDGKIIIAGFFGFSTNGNGFDRYNIARYNADGTLDSFYPGQANGGFYDIALQPDGKVLVGGGFSLIGNTQIRAIARLNMDGTIDSSFDAMFASVANNANVRTIAIQPDGKILVGGQFGNIGGQPRSIIARLNPNGTADNFDPSGTSGGIVNSIVVQPDGKILVGGGFSTMGGQPRNNIARLNPNDTDFDFDGDGKADVSVFRPSNGAWYLNQSTAGFTGITFGNSTDLPAPADFDGDGKTDVAVFRPSNGAWYYLRSSDGAFVGLTFGQNGDLPRPADFDGDGKADINVFRPSNGAWYRLNSTNGSFFGTLFGQNGDKPLIADFDGDGKSDIAVFRPSNGTFYWLNSLNGGFGATAFGLGTDIPTPGDFDGDGKTDIAVFRPSNGAWYRLNSSNGSFFGVGFGQNGDIPVTGDYDGDGKSDIAVFRPSTGNWYYLKSSNGGFVGLGFGLGTDKPIPAAF